MMEYQVQVALTKDGFYNPEKMEAYQAIAQKQAALKAQGQSVKGRSKSKKRR